MNTRTNSSAVACVLIAMILAGCGFGLSPSWKDRPGTSVSLSLATLGSGSSGQASRAVMPGVNYLYIRTVGIAGKSTGALYGPFTVEAGTKFVTNEIAPGEYERISVLASGKDLETGAPAFDVYGGTYTFRELMTLPDAQFLEFVGEDVDKSPLDEWFEGMACFGEIMGVTIVEGTENALSLTLTPNISDGYRIDLYGAPVQVFTSSERARRFYRLDGIQLALPITTETLSCTLTAASGSGTEVYGLAFYSRDGVPLSGTKSGTDLASGITLTLSSSDVAALADSTGYIELYQYLDFAGTVTANYQGAESGDITVSFDGQGNSALFGRRLLLAVYDASVLPLAAAGQSWETLPVLAYAIMNLDSATGSGSVTIPATGTSGAGYCVSAQIDMGGHYAGLSSLDTVDLATIVPFTGDYLTDGPMGLVPFLDVVSTTMTIADFVPYTETVYFVSQAGGGTGDLPGSPMTLSDAILAVNNTPAITSAQIYVMEPLSNVSMFTINGKDVSIKSYESAPVSVASMSYLSSMPFIGVTGGGSLNVERLTLDCSGVSMQMASLITLNNESSSSLTLGYGSKLIGQKTQAFSGQGGGVFVGMGCTLMMTGGTIDSCRANEGSAIYVNASGVAYLEKATITNNVHDVAGNGAIAVAGYVYANPVTFSGNTNDENTCILAGGVWTAMP